MALQVDIKKKFPGFYLETAFEINGGCMGILGASGCGKSMTLKCIAGIETPDEGRIVLNGRTFYDSQKKINLRTQERGVGYLFQNYALFPTMTLEENIAIAIPGKNKEKQGTVQAVIRQFRLEGLEKRYPSELSGGQQQRGALARMLVHKPELIMLDEPFSALDGFLKDVLQLEMLELLQQYEGNVLMVSHNRDEIFKFCDSMTLLSDGRGILTGSVREIFEMPKKMEAARLTGCKNISAITKIGEYQLLALDWNMILNTREKIGDHTAFVGVRAHRLMPAWENTGENTMKIVQDGYTETPFERQYLFRNAKDENSSRIWWIADKEKFTANGEGEFPPYMKFPKEHLMLLE